MLLAIVVTTTWLRTGVAHDIVRPLSNVAEIPASPASPACGVELIAGQVAEEDVECQCASTTNGAAVGATALARPNGAIATFPSDELCGIVPLGGFQTYSKMDAYRNRQKFNRHNNIARDEE
ncbi:hypothetical protein EMIHUDRAFT_238733 [Emiliania huxleyi CCMP1516]|uniref:Secreted protein n=2 Tax=Emiliania huxleyi TaxID=2903 RepID=A0A0D3JLA2_EMIH1|nr:hypothetical protein EMIHUDRAFT_210398 [Emiliania huxleyi CCMP1516]XP_005776716.1 hypothetical protein EMIHUDRAFT_238733 [Emiliania huxleyi CCMP1516]EOD16821.1 hypothetical protein EMIHUDRAFT_210398 [Emiliania huxleyi CCMP1516]EOD24287.1 hypothetical protein EMIHUDRAFT_238733 [Emiliania huxleyi CCMP1516]|eukprot:XP_005769250.1 hypothetical protein EMIHUDRAFT_210398 [Emiliania huxleyi CCMP1516]